MSKRDASEHGDSGEPESPSKRQAHELVQNSGTPPSSCVQIYGHDRLRRSPCILVWREPATSHTFFDTCLSAEAVRGQARAPVNSRGRAQRTVPWFISLGGCILLSFFATDTDLNSVSCECRGVDSGQLPPAKLGVYYCSQSSLPCEAPCLSAT